jgi:ABC-type branched-subunit amino acid transport system substrate-binding protein
MKLFLERFRKAFGGEYPSAYALFGYEAIHFIKSAVEKAKSVKKEDIVNALEAAEIASPRGKISFRKYDHIANGPVYVGLTTKSAEYPFYVYKNTLAVPAEQTWLSEEEIKNIRGKK